MALTYSYISATDSYSVVNNSCTAGAVVIPSTYDNGINGTKPVMSIGNSAFTSCSALTSITIPNSVTSIGAGVFEFCTSLTNITIPNSVTSIGIETFKGCTNLASVSISNSLTSIGSIMFAFTSLTSVTIPNSVTSIGNSAFAFCSKLTSVKFLGNAPTLGTDVFNSTNSSLKIYRKKFFVTGWTSTFGGKPVVLISDNVIKSGASGKLTTKRYLYKATGTGLTPNINGFRFYDSGLTQFGKPIYYDETNTYQLRFAGTNWLISRIQSFDGYWARISQTSPLGAYSLVEGFVGTVTISAI